MAGAADVRADVTGSKVVYRDIMPGTDVELEVSGTSLKDTIVLKSRDAATSWVFPLELRGLTAQPQADGSVALRNAAGAIVISIPAGSMSDSKFTARPARWPPRPACTTR